MTEKQNLFDPEPSSGELFCLWGERKEDSNESLALNFASLFFKKKRILLLSERRLCF